MPWGQQVGARKPAVGGEVGTAGAPCSDRCRCPCHCFREAVEPQGGGGPAQGTRDSTCGGPEPCFFLSNRLEAINCTIDLITALGGQKNHYMPHLSIQLITYYFFSV